MILKLSYTESKAAVKCEVQSIMMKMQRACMRDGYRSFSLRSWTATLAFKLETYLAITSVQTIVNDENNRTKAQKQTAILLSIYWCLSIG